MFRFTPLLASMLWAASALPAAAYIGPGAGLTAIGTALAVLGALLLLAVGFVWYPLKRLSRALRGRQAAAQPAPEE
jgi:hypothetical protein